MDMENYDGMLEYIKKVCAKNDWILNQDQSTLNELINILVDNIKRYGYPSCACRMADGIKDEDSDIICPCHYAPADVKEFGSCYCDLFMRLDMNNKKSYTLVPERRYMEKYKMKADHISIN